MSKTYDAESRIADFLSFVLQTSCLDITFTIVYDEAPAPHLTVHFQGADVSMLTLDGGGLLEALKYLVLQTCGLPNDQVGLDYVGNEATQDLLKPVGRRS